MLRHRGLSGVPIRICGWCHNQHPDVALVDYHLHDRLDGLATLDALRAASPGPIAGASSCARG